MGHVDLTAKVLAARADVCRQDAKQGFAPLHIAAKKKCDDIVRLLLDARADGKQTIKSGKTAADLAALNGASDEVVALLGSTVEKTIEPLCTGLAGLTLEQRAALHLD